MDINTSIELLEKTESKKNKFSSFFKLFSNRSKSVGEKVWKTLFIVALYVLAIIGIVFGTINLETANDKKGLFGETYTVTYKLDTNDNDLNKAKEETKTSAEKFSNWLLYKGISNNGVSYEVKQEKNSSNQDVYVGYLFVNFINIEQFYFSQTDEDVNVDPTLVAATNFNNSGIEVWKYDQPANYNGSNPKDLYGNSPVLASTNFNYDTASKDSRDATDDDGNTQNTLGVQLNLQNTYNIQDGSKFKTQADAENYDALKNGKLEWLVFQNMDSLVNKLNYAKYVVINYKEKTNPSSPASTEEQKKWTIIYESLKSKDSDLVAWADVAALNKGSTNSYNGSVITKENLVWYYQHAAGVDTYTNYPSDADTTLKTVVDKYLLGTVTKDNYKQWFPSTSSTINFEKQNTISIQKTGATVSTQESLIYEFKNTTLPVQFLQSPANANITNKDEFKLNGTGWISNPYIKEGVTKLSSYHAILIASGVILLIIAIIVSVLYRIPGIMGSFAIISSIVFSAALLVVLKANFSIGTIIGLMIGSLIAIVCVSFTMERVRRLLHQKNSVFDSIQTALKKSLMTTIDINATTIILALSLFFFSKGELSDLGLSLVLTPLLILGCIYLFFYFPLYLYSGERKFWYVKYTMMSIPTENKIKIWFNHKKWWFIWLSISILIIIAGIVFALVGVTNSSFNNGTIVYISGVSSQQANSLINAFGNKWFGGSFNNNVFEISSNYSFSTNEVQNIVNSVVNESSYTLNVSTLAPTISYKVFLSGIYGLLAGFGFSLIYYVIRSNVLVVIPIFLVNCFVVMFAVGISYLVQFPISNFFVYAMTTSGLISNIFVSLFVSVIKTRFNRRKIFDVDKIELFIKNNIKSLLNTIFLTTFLSLVNFIIVGVIVSPTTLYIFINIAVMSVVVTYISFFLIAHVYYYVIIIRQLYINNIFYNIDSKINSQFKEVDEQLIYSINKFH